MPLEPSLPPLLRSFAVTEDDFDDICVYRASSDE